MTVMSNAFGKARKALREKEAGKQPKPSPKAVVPTRVVRPAIKRPAPVVEVEPTEVPWSYREIARYDNVLVTIPTRENKYMSFITGHSFVTSTGVVRVPDHWKCGQVVEGKVIVNRHYYVPSTIVGTRIIAQVVIMLKERGTQSYLYLDFHHQPEGKPQHELKFVEDGDVKIPGSKTCIKVIERK